MSAGVKPSVAIAAVVGVVIVIGLVAYFAVTPKNTPRPVAGGGMTVQKLILKAQKDPNSLTPVERDYYSKLSPAMIDAIKNQPADSGPSHK